MDNEKRLKILEYSYAGALADSLLRYTREGILEKITRQKKAELEYTAQKQNETFGVKEPQDVFIKLSEIFNCAKWDITQNENGFSAVSKNCLLCGLAKKMNSGNPCYIYCLNPMKAMIKALGDYRYVVEETLFEGECCKINIQHT